MGLVLLIIGSTGAVTLIGKYIPKPVVRRVQLSTGTLLMVGGIKLMLGTSKVQLLHEIAEPFLTIQQVGPVDLGIIVGVVGGFITLLLLENKRLPAGLMIVMGGALRGFILGTREGLEDVGIGFNLPDLLPLAGRRGLIIFWLYLLWCSHRFR